MAVTLGEALESALASMLNEVGEDGVGAPSDAVNVAKSRVKQAGTEAAPASWEEAVSTKRGNEAPAPGEVTQPGKAPASCAEGTGRATHNPSALPPRRVARPLFSVIEGGRTEAGGNASVQPIRRAKGGEAASEWLYLVVG